MIQKELALSAQPSARDGAAIKDAAVIKITALDDSELILVDTP
jgi:hypothetical protein